MRFHKQVSINFFPGLLALLFTLALVSIVSAQDTYVYVEDEFQVDYPSTWRLDQSKVMGPVIFFYAPPADENDQFQENVNLLIQELGDDDFCH